MTHQKILTVFDGKNLTPPPVWFMRQAGRYLPEYRSIRSKFDSFMSLCSNTDAVVEVTLQPIRRFNLDAAIIFSDILIIPHLLGQTVAFESEHGPQLLPIDDFAKFWKEANLAAFIDAKLSPLSKAISLVRSELPKEKTLIGFSGSPWTILCYMINSGKNRLQSEQNNPFSYVVKWALDNPALFRHCLRQIEYYVVALLLKQIESGVDLIQIFDSWARCVPNEQIEEWVFVPTQRIISRVRRIFPHIPILYFGKGIASHYSAFQKKLPSRIGFSIDHLTPIKEVVNSLSKDTVIQGNLNPEFLEAGTFEEDTIKILKETKTAPFIFNLGHGILKSTPIDHVERLIDLIHQ